mgnify:CR=1 FL=1
MNKIQKAYASAPKTWIWQLLAAFIVACLLAWSASAVRVSNPTGNGLEVAKNILSGIFHPSPKLLFTLGTNGVPYLLLETFCIAFLGTIVGAVISLPLSFLSASNLVPRPIALIGRTIIAAIRTVPAFVYGLMFIRVTGPGPFAGLLTMSLCSIGMVSKMFIESIEDLDKRILESLDAAGCTARQDRRRRQRRGQRRVPLSLRPRGERPLRAHPCRHASYGTQRQRRIHGAVHHEHEF